MKKIILPLVFIFLCASDFYQAQTVELSIVNQSVVGTDFFFEIQMRATVGTLYFAGADLVLTFNNANFTGPVTTLVAFNPSYWTLLNSNGNNSTSSFGNLSATYRGLTSPAAITANEIILNVNIPTFIDQDAFDQDVAMVTNTIVTFGRYKVSGISNSSGNMNLTWKTAGGGVLTRIMNFANSTPWAQNVATITTVAP